MTDSQILDFESREKHQQRVILRVYNYYRVGLSFLFLFIHIHVLDFISEDISEFVGSAYPDLFLTVVITYLCINIAIGLFTLVSKSKVLTNSYWIFGVLLMDVIGLTLLMYASGGVSSGIGNFLIFTVSFAGGLIRGKISTVIPAIAFIFTSYSQSYLFFLGQSELQGFFQTGILGIVYFVANVLFQTISTKLQSREKEVFTLEQVNQHVIDSMRTGVLVVSSAGDIQMQNSSAYRLLAEGDHQRTLTLPSDLLQALKEWSVNQTNNIFRFSLPASTGTLMATISDLHNYESEPDRLIFIEDSEDIQKQAQQLNLASLGRLSATIAHEIRNPLGAISHAAQLLGESDNLPKGDLRLAEIIQDHCLRVNKVVENVLQLSRRKAPEPRDLELKHWLEGFVQDFEASLDPKPIVNIQIDPADLSVSIDPLHLSQILGNLCQNGIRYSVKKCGEPRIDIIGKKDERTNNPSLEIIDYGDGVAEDQIGNLFEPFFTTEATGTGIGLYLSKELCHSNHAQMTYSKASTGGSCFKIVFGPTQRI